MFDVILKVSYGNIGPPNNVLSSTESETVRSSAGDERASDGNSDGDICADAPVSGASVSSSPPNDIPVKVSDDSWQIINI